MGGCYGSYAPSQPISVPKPKKVRKPANPQWQQLLQEFVKTRNLDDLLSANKALLQNLQNLQG